MKREMGNFCKHAQDSEVSQKIALARKNIQNYNNSILPGVSQNFAQGKAKLDSKINAA